MEKLDENFGKSEDIIAKNIEQLKQLFPEAFTEGKIDFEVLKQLLGEYIDTNDEKYSLNWFGKKKARQFALTPSLGTLRPCPEDSVDWDTTKNIMIEGDNLEVLKLLEKSYSGVIKIMYIDPPYNTGKDFVYPDNYEDTIKNYLELTGQTDGGAKISSNTENSGRFHTDWLNMMYPRIKKARSLLHKEGVIMINMGDREIHNLRQICDDIFGEENFITTAVWEKKNKGAFLSNDITNMKDYIAIYCCNKQHFSGLIGQIVEEEETYPCINATNTRETRTIPAGISSNYREKNYFLPIGSTISVDTMNLVLHSDLCIEDGKLVKDLVIEGNWRYRQELMTQYAVNGELYLTQDLYLRRIVRDPRRKTLRDLLPRIGSSGNPATSIDINDLFLDGWGTNEDANEELRQLLGEQNILSYPKPLQLIAKLICSVRDENAVILDFFAGSATTGHAVWKLNALDSGTRRFILVQLPEPLNPNDPTQKVAAHFCASINKPLNIAEITKERLRRAGTNIKDAYPALAGDLGFRVFKLDSSNIKAWDPANTDIEGTIEDYMENIKAERSEQDILFELLLKLGLDLSCKIESRDIANKLVHNIGFGVLLVCLATNITNAEIEPLAKGMIEWIEEQNPEAETMIVFRDSAFADDVAKTNITAIFNQHGFTNIRSL